MSDSGMVNTRTSGRAKRPLFAEFDRELTQADLEALSVERGVKPPSLKRITETHHSIAQLLGQGESGASVALATGYSQSRISILRADPAFQELIAYYRSQSSDTLYVHHIDSQLKGKAVYDDILEVIHDKVLEESTSMQMADLVDAGKFVGDRSGFGPSTKSTSTNLNVNFADALAAGRQRASQLSAAIPAAKAARSEGYPLLEGRAVAEEGREAGRAPLPDGGVDE